MSFASVFQFVFTPVDDHFIQATNIITNETSTITVIKNLVNALIINGKVFGLPISLSHTKHFPKKGIDVFSGTHVAHVPLFQYLQSQYCFERH